MELPKYIPMARLLNIALAGWLFVSSFIWWHMADEVLVVALFMTALITAFELMALMEPTVRFATTLMGVLLVLEGIFVKHYLAWHRWHDIAIGVLVTLISLVPNKALPAPDEVIEPSATPAPKS